MTLRPFYAYEHEAPAEETETPGPWASDDPHHVKWGYTIADLHQFARFALARCRVRTLIYDDGLHAAWSAIAEDLCTAEVRPDPQDLIEAGRAAVALTARADLQTHGYNPDTSELRPRWARYWDASPTPSHEHRVIESMTLWQIIPTLTDLERRSLYLLAATEDYQLAAEAMGKSKGTYIACVARARRRYLAAWHEGETPSRVWRTDRRLCSRTRRGVTADQLDTIRERRHAGETLVSIAPDYGVTATTLGRLLAGKARTAPMGTP